MVGAAKTNLCELRLTGSHLRTVSLNFVTDGCMALYHRIIYFSLLIKGALVWAVGVKTNPIFRTRYSILKEQSYVAISYRLLWFLYKPR